jgi:hypothetical protein
MNRVDAIIELIREGQREHTTQTAINRVLRACKAIGLDRQETIRVLMHLDFSDSAGKPWREGLIIKLPE